MRAAWTATRQAQIGQAWTWVFLSVLSALAFTGILEVTFQGNCRYTNCCFSLIASIWWIINVMFTPQGAILGFGRMAPWAHSSDDLHGQLYCQLPLGGQVRVGIMKRLWDIGLNFNPFRLQPGLKKPGPDSPREEKERFIKAKWACMNKSYLVIPWWKLRWTTH